MIHVLWGYIWVGSYDSNVDDADRKSIVIQENLIRLTNRKAKYIHIFVMNCIGFFHFPLNTGQNKCRSPPS